ncbi:MAG: hypothetical protein NUW37_02340 [Planctomycetes bacterium]|nr:hypothetical protein [Planctomycetota bacterium]
MLLTFAVESASAQQSPPPDDDAPEQVVHEVGVNLLSNGDFESADDEDDERPAGWVPFDGITAFWDRENGVDDSGCVLLDNTPEKDQVYEVWERLRLDGDREQVTDLVPRQGTYSTIASTYGALCWSEYVGVEPDATYKLSADVKAVGVDDPEKQPLVMLWLKGYIQHRGRLRVIYKGRKECHDLTDEFQNFSRIYHPTKQTPRVHTMRVMLVAYFPVGYAWVDNVVLEKIIEEEE